MMTEHPAIEEILDNRELSRAEIVTLLRTHNPRENELIRAHAEELTLRIRSGKVYYRGLIEFSNQCANDCLYCGIRAGNAGVRRYRLEADEIIDAALWCAKQGYGSVVLQSGERTDPGFVDFVEGVVSQIKSRTTSTALPHGVGITLSVGEQSPETYRRFFHAGAHRYLLRIESSSPALYARIHPPAMSFDSRTNSLQTLKCIGFLVGTGVMIGLPGQTIEHLADDILFFKKMHVDMIGMGPYIPHDQTPMAHWPDINATPAGPTFELSLRMIAVTRIVLRNANIAATTALQALKPDGREQGLRHGANIVMPNVTPTTVRADYQLYRGKPCMDESADQCKGCLENRIRSVGREVGYGEWGDADHLV